ncbi:EAL domain-containing response regulator [Paraglaciecola sp.]|uniref:EAL domain-containing response regulator n=1 Tax=Paraglaciecola sp. TaxID=1920173 RepID=UPI0030F49444
MKLQERSFDVLVIDDSISQRHYMTELCKNSGAHKIVSAANGSIALSEIDNPNNKFDIIICDLEMPDLNGIELISLLGARKNKSAILIVSGREQSLISAVELMATMQGLWILGSVKKPLLMNSFQSFVEEYFAKVNHLETLPRTANSAPLSVNKLRELISDKKLILHFQPKMNMQNGQLDSVEALVRLMYNDCQIVFPNDFIPLCEQHGLIDQLSFEVLRMALEQRRIWLAQGLDVRISINLSSVSFDNADFSEQIIQMIKASGGDAASIIFEITETAIISDMSKALLVLTRLRLLGCGLSIDDYGTGYSSVKQLSQIPFTEIKLDRSLIDGIASKPHLQIIYESTLSMANKLGIGLVAEGIETLKDWEYLRNNGCPIGQGYYYSPPMSESALLDWWKVGMPALK